MKMNTTPPTVPQTRVVNIQEHDETSASLVLPPVSDPYAGNDPRRISLLAEKLIVAQENRLIRRVELKSMPKR